MYMEYRHAQKHILCVQYKEKRTDTAAVKNPLLRTLENKHYSMYNTCALFCIYSNLPVFQFFSHQIDQV